jgi:hypothetical protein
MQEVNISICKCLHWKSLDNPPRFAKNNVDSRGPNSKRVRRACPRYPPPQLVRAVCLSALLAMVLLALAAQPQLLAQVIQGQASSGPAPRIDVTTYGAKADLKRAGNCALSGSTLTCTAAGNDLLSVRRHRHVHAGKF